MKQCKKCHAEMADGDVFCTRCGTKNEAAASATADYGFGNSGAASASASHRPGVRSAKASDDDRATQSLFVKYAGFLDNEALFKVAWAKEQGLLRDGEAEAEEIYKLLALRGHIESMFRFALMQMAKVPPATEVARKWLNAAADLGHVGADTYLKTEMPPEVPPAPQQIPVGGDQSLTTQPQGGCLSGEQIFDKLGPTIIEITAEDGQVCAAASGFTVSSTGFILTNAHAILMDNGEPFPKLTVKNNNGTFAAFPVMFGAPSDGVHNSIDIALLVAPDMIGEIDAIVELGDSDTVRNGQKVYLIGNSLGIGTCITSGIVSDAARQLPGLEYPYIMTDAAANHGNSGGPFIDEHGKVIGVLVAGIDNAQGMNFVIPINVVKIFTAFMLSALELDDEVLGELAQLRDAADIPLLGTFDLSDFRVTREPAKYAALSQKIKNKNK